MSLKHPTWRGEYDTLVGDSSVRLFGRLMWDIKLQPDRGRAYEGPDPSELPPLEDPPAQPHRKSRNNFLIDQLKADDAALARIHAFSYQNELFSLARPAVFVVHGDGIEIEFPNEPTDPTSFLLRKVPAYAERSGLAGQKGSFATGMKMWLYDRADFTVRLDTESGTFEQVLLEYELGGGIGSGSMQSGDGDDVPPPPRRRRRYRRWRSGDD